MAGARRPCHPVQLDVVVASQPTRRLDSSRTGVHSPTEQTGQARPMPAHPGPVPLKTCASACPQPDLVGGHKAAQLAGHLQNGHPGPQQTACLSRQGWNFWVCGPWPASLHHLARGPEPAPTLILLVASNPSSWLSSSSMVRCTSLSPPPPLPESLRALPMLSTSSMKMMLGECSLHVLRLQELAVLCGACL